MTRVLVAGSNGFIGRLITNHLATEHPHIEVARLVRTSAGATAADAIAADVSSADALAQAFAGVEPDVVINAAGLINGNPAELFVANSVFPAILVDALNRSTKPVRLIQIGSAAEYGLPKSDAPLREDACCDPVSLYGITKLAGAQAALVRHGAGPISVVHVRLFNIVAAENSPNQVLGAFAERVRSFGGAFTGGTIQMGNLGAVRDFIAAADFLDAITRLIDGAEAPSVLNIASANGLSVRAVLHGINNALPVPFVIEETEFRSAANSSNMAILGDASALTKLLGRPVSSIGTVLEAVAQGLSTAAATGA